MGHTGGGLTAQPPALYPRRRLTRWKLWAQTARGEHVSLGSGPWCCSRRAPESLKVGSQLPGREGQAAMHLGTVRAACARGRWAAGRWRCRPAAVPAVSGAGASAGARQAHVIAEGLAVLVCGSDSASWLPCPAGLPVCLGVEGAPSQDAGPTRAWGDAHGLPPPVRTTGPVCKHGPGRRPATCKPRLLATPSEHPNLLRPAQGNDGPGRHL